MGMKTNGTVGQAAEDQVEAEFNVCSASTWEAEAREWLVCTQPRLHSKTL